MPLSFRCAPSPFHLQCGSEAGRANCVNGRRAHGRRVDCVGLRTLILALPGVLTIAALLRAAVLADPEVILCVRTRMKRIAAA